MRTPAGRLTRVDEAQPGQQQRQDGRRLVDPRRKYGRGTRLIVVLEKSHGAALIVGVGAEMTAHGAGILSTQAVVEALVVREVEALLLERPLEIPVRLGHEHELGAALTDVLDGHRPERIVDEQAPVAGTRPVAPRAVDDLGQDEHGHVAPHAVALTGDGSQHVQHGPSQLRMTVIELERVGPAGEVRVTPVGEHARP